LLSGLEDPKTIAMILGFSFGYLYGEAFSKFDKTVKYDVTWFQNLNPVLKWFIASFLDANHHFQYGLILMLVTSLYSLPAFWPVILWWAGAGLLVSDWKDYQNVLSRLGLVTQNSQSSSQDDKTEEK